ncbi:hypothetical protein SAMN05444166_0638 [Singulisphaera sp. GP187]|uniref:hypothetical protein n=1 Tax=Singulisphaera sp. GP187 TaxID=1882752 RepID=UPI00092B79D6|nr:hypothetical protein [Singulisphaera sp. GP187]SIN75227.1 hypothetical protein SAMN05444166_0638 [Singulisphaera sp. GP187]
MRTSTGCKEILSTLATGGLIRRWWARRHADRCPRCSTVRDELRQIAEELAAVPPLPVVQRRRWHAAAADHPVKAEPSRAWWTQPALAMAVLGAVGGWWAFRLEEDPPPGPPAVVGVAHPAVREERLRVVEGLRGRVVALTQELDDLHRRADLLDARKEVDALMARLVPRGGSSGL